MFFSTALLKKITSQNNQSAPVIGGDHILAVNYL